MNGVATLKPASSEQQLVLDMLSEGYNVVVDSVAGSGKTTTILHIAGVAKQYDPKSILLLTYNAKLKDETREKVSTHKLASILGDVHSYHSFCVTYYSRRAYTDAGMYNTVIMPDTPPIKPFTYDMIIIDETQDMTPLYYKLVCKIYRDNMAPRPPQICIFGDKNQCIFEFNDADARYIVDAPYVFGFDKTRTWVECHLTMSFRVTNQIAAFVNKCMLKTDRIRAFKDGIKPRYVRCDAFHDMCYASPNIIDMPRILEKYRPGDILIMVQMLGKTKSKSQYDRPIRVLENWIKKTYNNTINVYMAQSDHANVNKKAAHGKILIATYHQTKGIERRCVIVLGFDDFMEHFNPTPLICPNTLYVAATRAIDELILVHHHTNNHLSFLASDLIPAYSTLVTRTVPSICNKRRTPISPPGYSASDLAKHIQFTTLQNCMDMITCIKLRDPVQTPILLPSEIDISYNACSPDVFHEDVSDINGTAIPLIFSINITHRLPLLNACIEYSDYTIQDSNIIMAEKIKLEQIKRTATVATITVEDVLRIANFWSSCQSGFIHKIYQLDGKYTWLSCSDIAACMAQLATLNISPTAHFEVPHAAIYNNCLITGHIDCIDSSHPDHDILYEFKCVSELSLDHYIQLAIYMFLHMQQSPATNRCCRYMLFNILTGELVELIATMDQLEIIIATLINSKENGITALTDTEFHTANRAIAAQYGHIL